MASAPDSLSVYPHRLLPSRLPSTSSSRARALRKPLIPTVSWEQAVIAGCLMEAQQSRPSALDCVSCHIPSPCSGCSTALFLHFCMPVMKLYPGPLLLGRIVQIFVIIQQIQLVLGSAIRARERGKEVCVCRLCQAACWILFTVSVPVPVPVPVC